jgi:glutamate/tyrosine decarboxylase-like PLP-dependent enzyme
VLFADPAVGRFYVHDSPYTYFTSDELHLGEISLECSRAGASAAAAWLTFRLLPLTAGGLGRVLAAGRLAALEWAELLRESAVLDLYQAPQLDIVTYFPVTGGRALSAIDGGSASILRAGMADAKAPVFLSTLRVSADAMQHRHPDVTADAPGARILRSVLMKPESQTYASALHARVEELARQLPA